MVKDKAYVLKEVKDKNVKFIRLWFTDVLGFLKSFSISPDELEGAFDEGMGFDGSSIEGFARIEESDMVAKPDPATFVILPWRANNGSNVARMFCDILTPDGIPYDGDPRYALKRNLKKAADLGFTFYVGPELEFFYFKSATGKPEILDHGGYFDLTPWMWPAIFGGTRFSPWMTWASRWNTAITRWRRASTRSTSGTPKPSPWPTSP